jgi:hypothetical protein
MSLMNPDVILFDINGNPYGVSASMQLPVGAIGQLLAGVDNSVSGSQLVTWLSMSAGALVVTGSVLTTVVFPAEQGVIVGNWPAVIGISGSQLTGSTFNGFPVTAGGVFSGSNGYVVKGLQVDSSGALVVTITGTLPVSVTNTVDVIVENWPAVIATSGSQLTGSTFGGFPVTVGGVFSGSNGYVVKAFQTDVSGALVVTMSGTIDVAVTNFPAVQAVSITGQPIGVIVDNWPAVVGVTGSVNVYTSGPQAVSGTVSVTGSMVVTGPYQSGSTATAPIYPLIDGGVDINGITRVNLLDPQGRSTNPVTGSAVTSVPASLANQTALFPNASRVGAAFFNEGSATAFLKFGIGATLTNYTVQLGQKAYYELPYTFTGRVDVIFNGTTGNLRVTELF